MKATVTPPRAAVLTTKQRILIVLAVPLVPFFFCLASGVPTMRARNPVFHDPSTAALMPQLSDLHLSIAMALVFVALRRVLLTAFAPMARRALPAATATSTFRVDRFATSMVKLLYFTTMVAVGFYIQRDAPWLPPSLGGSGDVTAAFVTAPTTPPSSALQRYMLVQFAYLLHNLIFVVACKPVDADTMDYVIHDLTAMLLVGSAFLVNYNAIGATIALLNDACDVVHYVFLLASDARRLWAVAPMWLVFLVGWWYTRLYVYPRECLYVMIVDAPIIDPHVATLYLQPTNAMLSLLLGLQIYWYQILARKGLRVLREAVNGGELLAVTTAATYKTC